MRLLQKMTALYKLLDIPRGITSVVGGGGKTSLIERLGRELSESARVLSLTTTRVWTPADRPVLLNPAPEEVECAFQHSRFLTVGSAREQGKLGAPEGSLRTLFALADYVLIEADGSRGLPVKAPGEHEPVLTGEEALIVAVAGLSAVGRPIAEAAHRPALFAALTGKPMCEPVTPNDIALVLQSPLGQRKNVSCRCTVLLNQCDNDVRLEAAKACTARLDQRLISRVVAAALQKRPDWMEVLF